LVVVSLQNHPFGQVREVASTHMIGKTINGHTRRPPCLSPLDSLPAIAFHHRATMDRRIATFLCLLKLLNAAQAKEAKPNTVDHAGLMQAWD